MVMKDEDDNTGFEPFSTDNDSGSIEPNSQVNITLKFSPIEVYLCKRKLYVYIKGQDSEPLCLIVEGSSERPICHFELDSSKLIEKLKDQQIEVPPRANIVDIESIGTKVKNMKRFYVLNPTNEE